MRKVNASIIPEGKWTGRRGCQRLYTAEETGGERKPDLKHVTGTSYCSEQEHTYNTNVSEMFSAYRNDMRLSIVMLKCERVQIVFTEILFVQILTGLVTCPLQACGPTALVPNCRN